MLKADLGTAERAKAIASFGITERQARFLTTVMWHSGVFVGRQYAAFAGITHGQKVHDFVERLLVRRFVTPIELGPTGRTRIFHVHRKPLYAAIGEPDNRNRRRVTLDRAIERLMVLDGVLFPRSLAGSMEVYKRAAYELLTNPLTPSQTEELIWFLRQPPPLALDASVADRARLQAARSAFRSPRFAAIRRHWIAEGNHAVFLAASPVARDTLDCRRSSVECLELPHAYEHLFVLARQAARRRSQNRGDEALGMSGPPPPLA